MGDRLHLPGLEPAPRVIADDGAETCPACGGPMRRRHCPSRRCPGLDGANVLPFVLEDESSGWAEQ